MIKKCKVILNNDAVTVVDFDGVEVQFPSINKETKYVNVLFDDNKYSIVDDDKENTEITDSSVTKRKKGNRSKKIISEDKTEKTNN